MISRRKTDPSGLISLGVVIAIFCLLSCQSTAANSQTHKTLRDIIQTHNLDQDRAVLVIKRLSDDQVWTSNSERQNRRFSPASTSKIPHTLIALETGIADPDTKYIWAGTRHWVKNWNQDQTLTSAFQYSAVWVYQAITQSLGSDIMSEWLNRFNYGNADAGTAANVTQYWLTGPLEISATEQIAFLSRLAKHKLPLSRETYERAGEIMFYDQGPDWRLYSKTGWYLDQQGDDIGWYVGWVVRADNRYVFAFNLDMPPGEESRLRNLRKDIVHEALKQLGIID